VNLEIELPGATRSQGTDVTWIQKHVAKHAMITASLIMKAVNMVTTSHHVERSNLATATFWKISVVTLAVDC